MSFPHASLAERILSEQHARDIFLCSWWLVSQRARRGVMRGLQLPLFALSACDCGPRECLGLEIQRFQLKRPIFVGRFTLAESIFRLGPRFCGVRFLKRRPCVRGLPGEGLGGRQARRKGGRESRTPLVVLCPRAVFCLRAVAARPGCPEWDRLTQRCRRRCVLVPQPLP